MVQVGTEVNDLSTARFMLLGGFGIQTEAVCCLVVQVDLPTVSQIL
jgi:hypothetical protein